MTYRYNREMAARAWKALPRQERETLINAVQLGARREEGLAQRALEDYAVTRYRRSFRASRDAARDRDARTLIGARVPREYAALVKLIAASTGRSVYRFVTDAVDRELDRCAE